MTSWQVRDEAKVKLKNPILVEGLPGIGNVGKVAVDFLIESTKAKKLATFFSYTLPHAVFVNEKNLVELPTIDAYYTRISGRDIVFLIGDVQPGDEVSCYEFCEAVLKFSKNMGCKEIITLGGIGLQAPPKTPRIYVTGTNPATIKKYMIEGVEKKIYGVVGPIIGVTGILAGLAEKEGIEAVVLLAETFGHPLYLGVKGARALILLLDKKLKLGVKIENLDKEIKELEDETLQRTRDVTQVQETSKLSKLKKIKEEVNYIG
ncbi:PAC2 family protein [Candidatus Woesearchaeota archaeon]|nr:PAC2 family protein [Candidatus Woesearchaeota archaeon]